MLQQQDPHEAAAASDVYALGVTWIELVTASLPSPHAIGAGAFEIPTGPEPMPGEFRLSTYDLSQLDAVIWLNKLPAESTDLVITDPPYESLEKHRAVGTTTRLKVSKSSSNLWFPIFPNSRFPELFEAVFRVLKKNSHFYLFCDQETMFVAKPAAEMAGFKFWKPLVWDKQKIGMGYHYRARYEFVLFFEKGKRKLNDLSVPDIITAPRVFRGYPTEKPAEVAEILVNQSTIPGDMVADPFCGSGSTGVAAVRNGRSFCGNDIQEYAVTLTRNRLGPIEVGTSELPSDIRQYVPPSASAELAMTDSIPEQLKCL